jgi:hypothetical protein
MLLVLLMVGDLVGSNAIAGIIIVRLFVGKAVAI